MMNSIKTKVITGILAAAMAVSTLTTISTPVFADELLYEGEFDEPEVTDEFCDQDNEVLEPEGSFSDEDFINSDLVDTDIITDDSETTLMEDDAIMADDPAEEVGTQNTNVPPDRYIPSGNAKFYKRDGEYYVYSPDLGGEITVRTYAEIIKEICDTLSVDVAIEFAESIDDNPHDEEILRVFGPWEILDHWERRIDEKTNRWEL